MTIPRTKDLGPAEMRTVILLGIGILAAITGQPKESRGAKSNWFEAKVSSVMIQESILDYAAKADSAKTRALVGKNLGDERTRRVLKLSVMNLEGAYFTASDYHIISINNEGLAAIKVTGSKINAPHGSYLLQENRDWVKL